MQHGSDHDNRRFHQGKQNYNNTPPDDEVAELEARGGRPRTPEDIEKSRPARPTDEPIEREAEPARPHRPETDVNPQPSSRNEPVE